jgi:pimeloyl-ACP methyl ester carboxylesterase
MTRLTSFRNDGMLFDVSDQGPLDGQPVVLLHGFPQRATCWTAVTPLLTARGFRVLAPDQRGYSPAARPAGRAAYRITRLVADVVALIETLDRGPVHLVGHDWGAAVGWAIATTRPDLVRSFTAVSVPHPKAIVRSLLGGRQALMSWYVAAIQVPVAPEYVARRWPGWIELNLRRSGMDRAQLERFRTEILADGVLPSALAWYRAIPYGGPAGSGRISVPTTLVWSDGDVAISRAAAEQCGDFVTADYRLEILTGIDHWIPERAPARLAELITERTGGS